MTYDIIATGSTGNAVVRDEIWEPVRGFEGLYSVSNRGRLKSYKMNPHGKVLKLTNKKGDYLRVVLQGIGKARKSISVHRLVAEHFLPNPDGLPEVNHKDGNRQNNEAENLEWVTKSANIRHSISTIHPGQLEPMIRYNKSIRPKPILQIALDGTVINRFSSGAEACRITGVCKRNILQVANHTPFNEKGQIRKTAGGYIWRFESEVMPREV